MDLAEHLEKGLVHSIHTSVRRSFRSCRRRWDWSHRQMLYPKVTPAPLEFGVAFHKAMEAFYEPEMWNKDHEVQQALALKAFRDECDNQLKGYRKLNGEPEVDVLVEYKERVVLGLNMIKYYTDVVSPVYDQGFVPVDVEVPFEVPIVGPQGEPIWCKCDHCWNKYLGHENLIIGAEEYRNGDWLGLPVTYGGRLDMLAKDEHGRYWVVDWKTTSRMLNEGKEESFLELDDQISSYVWALKTYYNIPVAGFVYVEIKKAYPQPPEELTRLYKGRKYSTNKQFLTTHQIALDTFLRKDAEAFQAGLYDDYLEWLRNEGPRFHQRHQIHKNDYEIQQIGKNIYLEALDIIRDPLVYPTPGRFSCPSCLFRQPCLGVNQGEDYEYTLSTMFEKHDRHYYEEKEPSTE
jgi:hypothetical protein